MSAPRPSNCLYTDPACVQAWKELVEIGVDEIPPAGTHEKMRVEIAHVHVFLIDYLDSVWQGVDKCKGDERNFIQYARFACADRHNHHALEEEISFPYMQKLGVQSLEENIAEHAVMHAHLETLIAYLDSFLLPSPCPQQPLSIFSATRVQELVDALLRAVVPHLRNELETITGEKLAPYLTREALLEMDKMVMGTIMAYPATETLPGAMVNIKPGSPFPPLPWVLKKVLILVYFSRGEFAGCWKYGKYPNGVQLWQCKGDDASRL